MRTTIVHKSKRHPYMIITVISAGSVHNEIRHANGNLIANGEDCGNGIADARRLLADLLRECRR